MDSPEGPRSNLSDPTARPVVRDEDTFTPTSSMLPPPMPPGGDVEGSGRITRLSLTEMRHSLVEMRRTLLSIPLFNPRWKPWSPARVVRTTLAFAAVMALLVVATFKVQKRWAPLSSAAPAAALVEAPVIAPARAAPPRADDALARDRRSPVAGGLLTIPPAFRSPDGAYDLVIHLHGNTDLVEESYAISGLDAVVVILNLGNGSGVYEDRFANAFSLPEILDRTQTTLEKRGLAHARLRRLALTAWSAGYGGVLKVLEQPALAEKVDAVLLLDGIHVGYQPKSTELYVERLEPFIRFASRAVAGKALFSITHSNITPLGHYAGTHETTDALLRAVSVSRGPAGEAPPMPALFSVEGVIAKKRLIWLQPESEVVQGGLHVRGYGGDQPEHHIAHLVQMSATAVPDLVAWWKRPAN
jgi:hypothetical protein